MARGSLGLVGYSACLSRLGAARRWRGSPGTPFRHLEGWCRGPLHDHCRDRVVSYPSGVRPPSFQGLASVPQSPSCSDTRIGPRLRWSSQATTALVTAPPQSGSKNANCERAAGVQRPDPLHPQNQASASGHADAPARDATAQGSHSAKPDATLSDHHDTSG